ncbi:MAG: YqeG family HAD IIIA-type phosphatase [Clostridia bacterium]|nr:YqeG family HAD IIIA-type phosphatase [Clostridia bacterium]
MKHFFPDYYFHSVHELSPEFFLARKITHVIFDIDDTLTEHGVVAADEAVCALIRDFEAAGIRISLISNSKGERAKIFAESLPVHVFYIGHAKKPSRGALKPFFSHFNVECAHTALVGDQLLTDINLAKKWGLTAILVKPIAPYENPFFYLKRAIERPILKHYFRTLEKLNAAKED